MLGGKTPGCETACLGTPASLVTSFVIVSGTTPVLFGNCWTVKSVWLETVTIIFTHLKCLKQQ